MGPGAGLTGYDLVVIVFFALLILRGIWLGFLRQVTSLVALYLGYIIAAQYHDKIFPFLKGLSNNPKVVFFAACTILFLASYVVMMLIGKGLAYVMKLTVAGWFDKLLGGVLGAAKALILTLVIPGENKMLASCRICNALNKTTVYALDLIKDQEVKKILNQKITPISAQDVKDFFATPPKEDSLGSGGSRDKPPTEKPGQSDKPAPEKSSPVQ